MLVLDNIPSLYYRPYTNIQQHNTVYSESYTASYNRIYRGVQGLIHPAYQSSIQEYTANTVNTVNTVNAAYDKNNS